MMEQHWLGNFGNLSCSKEIQPVNCHCQIIDRQSKQLIAEYSLTSAMNILSCLYYDRDVHLHCTCVCFEYKF